MGLGHWLSEAVASVSESLTGRKRKAPDGRLDEENEDLGLPPAPPLPSIDRPVVKPSQHLPSNRAPQRLDFSSPAMNGPQRGTGQWPPLGAAGQEQQKANPSHPIRLPALPARRLDDMLGVAAGTYTRGQQDMQAGSAAAAAGLDGVVDGQPFARHFAPPRVSTPLRGGSTPDLLRGIQHVRDAPPSYAKVALTPAAAQYRKQQRYQEPPPGQMRGLPAGGSRNVTQPRQQQGLRGQVQGQPGGQQQWQQPHRGLHRQQQQQQQQHAGGGSSLHRLATAGRHADERPSSSQDAALLRRAVEVRLRQQEVQQQRYQEQRSRHQLAAGAGVEEVDLTAEPSPSQAAPLPLPRHQRAEQQQDQAPPAAARGMGEPRHWREILQQLKAEEEEGGLGRWGDGPTGGPLVAGVRSEGAERYQELVADAQLASRRALQAQEQELRFAQQAHTALERAQPQRAQQLEAEAQKIERQLRELQLQRQQQQQSVASMGMQQAEQQQGLGAAVKSAREQEDGQEVVELLSSSEEERASAETSVGGSESEGEGQEESEVSQQLEQIGLHEGSDAMLAIPDSWREEYEAALGPGPAGEVLTDHPRSSIQVCRRDMACMAPLQWLNDEVINLYISLLLERDMLRRKQGKGPRCHFFSTFFANKLYKDGGYSYDQVRRWTLPKRLSAAGQASESILNCDRVVVPVHQGMHWVCAVIDLQHRKLVYYDSLKGEDHNCLEQLARYLRDEYRDKRKQQRDDVLDWPREFPKRIPQQLNGCDCGVFTLLFANYAGRDAPLTFSQAHIDDLRVRIVHELLQLRVE